MRTGVASEVIAKRANGWCVARGKAPFGREALMVFATLCLAACGFQPLHSQAYRSGLAVDLSSLAITVAGTRAEANAEGAMGRRYSELLKAEIEEQTNPSAKRSETLFTVDIRYIEAETGLFVNPDGTASRGDLIYTSNYTVTRLSDSAPIARGSLSRTSSYNTSPTADYVAYVSIEDARKRGIIELAQDYKLRLAALLPTLNHPNAGRDALANDALISKDEKPLPTLQPMRTHETRPTGY